MWGAIQKYLDHCTRKAAIPSFNKYLLTAYGARHSWPQRENKTPLRKREDSLMYMKFTTDVISIGKRHVVEPLSAVLKWLGKQAVVNKGRRKG
jgi:hypothetical protein